VPRSWTSWQLLEMTLRQPPNACCGRTKQWPHGKRQRRESGAGGTAESTSAMNASAASPLQALYHSRAARASLIASGWSQIGSAGTTVRESCGALQTTVLA
jgi:hypothetical protein